VATRVDATLALNRELRQYLALQKPKIISNRRQAAEEGHLWNGEQRTGSVKI
jgi:hypothetical protein